jgi:hypothetical protein
MPRGFSVHRIRTFIYNTTVSYHHHPHNLPFAFLKFDFYREESGKHVPPNDGMIDKWMDGSKVGYSVF